MHSVFTHKRKNLLSHNLDLDHCGKMIYINGNSILGLLTYSVKGFTFISVNIGWENKFEVKGEL